MATYKVDGSKAAMADLTQVCEEFLRILLVKKFRHLRVLETPSPRTRRHGQRLHAQTKESLHINIAVNNISTGLTGKI